MKVDDLTNQVAKWIGSHYEIWSKWLNGTDVTNDTMKVDDHIIQVAKWSMNDVIMKVAKMKQ